MATINENTIGGTIDETLGSAQSGLGNVTGDQKTAAEGKLNELKGKAEQVLGKAKGAASQYADKAKDAAAQAADRAREWADNAPEPVQQARERAMRVYDDYSPKVRQAVQEQPLAVLAGGVALGFVLGALLSGGRRR